MISSYLIVRAIEIWIHFECLEKIFRRGSYLKLVRSFLLVLEAIYAQEMISLSSRFQFFFIISFSNIGKIYKVWIFKIKSFFVMLIYPWIFILAGWNGAIQSVLWCICLTPDQLIIAWQQLVISKTGFSSSPLSSDEIPLSLVHQLWSLETLVFFFGSELHQTTYSVPGNRALFFFRWCNIFVCKTKLTCFKEWECHVIHITLLLNVIRCKSYTYLDLEFRIFCEREVRKCK